MKGQLAFSTLGCPAWSFEQIVANAARMGFSAIEVRGVEQVLATDRLPCFQQENELATKALLEKYGVRLCGGGTSVSFHDPKNTEATLEEGRRAIDVCQRMGIPAIRVFGDRLAPEENREAVIERVADGITSLCDYARERGNVRVLLEIHGDFNTVEAVAPILARLGKHPFFGIIWDVEHSYRAYGENFESFYELIRPWIRHVHVKDCVMEGSEAIVRMPGTGTVNLAQILRRLKQDGYAGLYSFEWEKRWHPEIEEPEIALAEYVRCMQQWLADE